MLFLACEVGVLRAEAAGRSRGAVGNMVKGRVQGGMGAQHKPLQGLSTLFKGFARGAEELMDRLSIGEAARLKLPPRV